MKTLSYHNSIHTKGKIQKIKYVSIIQPYPSLIKYQSPHNRLIVVTIVFTHLFIFLQLRVDNLVQLHERLNKLLPHLALDLPGRIVGPEVIHLFLPHSIGIDLVKHFEGALELLGKDLAELSLRDLDPETTVGLFLVVLLQQVVEVLETYLTDFLHRRGDEMDEVFATEKGAVIVV
jgi:hypothetical protein